MVATWTDSQWQDVACEVRGFEWADGADRASGVLTSAAGGSWGVELYDPDRKLDPSNPSATFGRAVQPGRYCRLGYPGGYIGQGLIDSAGYEVSTGLARLRGTDYVGVLSAMDVAPPGAGMDGLRELARYVVASVGLTILSVEPDPPEGDTPIGEPYDPPTDRINAWELLQAAAQDALCMAYIDRDAVIRFAPHGDPVDVGLAIGCDGIPLIGLALSSTGDGIVNRVETRDIAGGPVVSQEDPESVKRYGARVLDRQDRKVPAASSWAAAVIADRAFASLEYLPVQIWPTAIAHVDSVFRAPMVAAVRIRADAVDPPVEVDARMIARGAKVTPDGWALDVLTYISDAEWQGSVLAPAEPDPLPPNTQIVTRSSVSAKTARVSKYLGTKLGAGAQVTPCPVGTFGGYLNRMLVYASVDWSGCREVVSAVLRLRTGTQINAQFGTQPRIRARRITEDWTEGTASGLAGSNAVIWRGPAATATGESVVDVTRTPGAVVDVDVTRIVRAWAPKRAGGNDRTNRGIQLQSYVESDPTRTTEFETDDAGTAAWRPELRVQMIIPA